MNRLTVAFAQSLIVATFLATSSLGQDEEALKKDLTAVIALQGKPCGQVVSVKVLGDNDYAASCEDGNKYHVYLNSEGRVMVDPQK